MAHLQISTAMEKAAMRILAEEGIKVLEDYINKFSSKIGRIEISIFNTKKSFGQRPEHVQSAGEILKYLQSMKKVLYNPGKYPELDDKLRMHPVANFISEYSPASESKVSYRKIHARLLEMSVPHTADFRKFQFLNTLSSNLGQNTPIPSVLVDMITAYLEDLPSEEFMAVILTIRVIAK